MASFQRLFTFITLILFAHVVSAENSPLDPTKILNDIPASSTNECEDLLSALNLKSLTLDVVENINALKRQVDDLVKNNGHTLRQSDILRKRRKLYLLATLSRGQTTEAISIYYDLFFKVELAFALIIHHERDLENLRQHAQNIDKKSNPSLAQQADVQTQKTQDELEQAYKDLGENYVEYIKIRHFLEKLAQTPNPETLPGTSRAEALTAKYVLNSLGIHNTARRFPELGMQSNFRPKMDDIEAVFKTRAQPLVAMYNKEIREEQKIKRFKWGYNALSALQKAAMSVGDLQVGPWRLGGPKLQSFLSSILLMNRDRYLRVQYLHRIEQLIQTPVQSGHRLKYLLDFCGNTCDEFLETFARLGYFTDEWIALKKDVEEKAKIGGANSQYARILKMMGEAEAIAFKSSGLSLNYAELSDDKRTQFLLSSAAISFWAFVVSTSPADLPYYWEQARSWITSLF